MEKNTNPPSSALPRRDFLKKTATAAAAVAATPLFKTPVYGQNQAPSANVTGANNRIQVAIVGVGFGIGRNHLKGIQEKATENNVIYGGQRRVGRRRADARRGRAAYPNANKGKAIGSTARPRLSRTRTFTMTTARCSSARTLTRC